MPCANCFAPNGSIGSVSIFIFFAKLCQVVPSILVDSEYLKHESFVSVCLILNPSPTALHPPDRPTR
jgi:hypothetical protein